MTHVSLRGLLAVALAGALSLGTAACGGSDDDSGSGGGGSSPLKIGASLPLTGDFSQPGTAAQQGYQVWQEMVNAEGGLLGRKVDLVVKDDHSDQNTVVSDYNALISQDKVDLLLGTFSSLLNIPASAVAQKQKMLYVEPAGGSPDMFNRDGFTPSYFFFAQQGTADKQGLPFVDWIESLPADQRPKTAAYPTLDDPFAAPVVEGAQAALEALGVKTVYSKTYSPDTKNFDTIASAIASAKPDLLFHGAQTDDGIGLFRAMLKTGYKPKMFFQTNAPSLADQYSKGVGEGNTEGVLFATSYSPEAKTEGNAEFLAKYKEMFDGAEPPEDAADAYAAAQVLQAAVEAVGSVDDQTKLADWLHENTVTTILGDLSWEETGAPKGDFLIAQWQGGSAHVVLPADVGTATIQPEWKPAG